MKLKQRVALLLLLLVGLLITKLLVLERSSSTNFPGATRKDVQSFRRFVHFATSLELQGATFASPFTSPWEVAAQWVIPREIYPEEAPEMAAVLNAMATSKIVHADIGFKGTQLKALLVLEGGQKVVFKPKRYSRDYIVEGEPYAGYDRHNAEVAAFHIDRILGFRRAPLVVGRSVNLKTEIKPVATERLLATFLHQGNNTCFYGKCYYCRETESACANGEIIEGSLTLWLPESWPLQKHQHPWGRTYLEGKLARWEYDDNYCEAVRKMTPYDMGPRLLDIMDTAIFDFLMGNADRHHYESFRDAAGVSMLILLDNAKSFGNPNADERSILAPLYQCCMVRISTWNRLHLLTEAGLSTLLTKAMVADPIAPVLSEGHLHALDRRLMAVVDTVRRCLDTHIPEAVLVEDRLVLDH
uniref:glycosaminoglycan xylosylkinase-like n=1 Tax=Myxine glutinosa TaxID=7769 RepID=UPI00358ED66F